MSIITRVQEIVFTGSLFSRIINKTINRIVIPYKIEIIRLT